MPSNDGDALVTPVAGVISECIRQLIQEYVAEPFLYLREANPQAKLWTMLRRELHPQIVRATVVPHRRLKQHPHIHQAEFKTSRVQLQMKVGGAKVTDIMVFRSDRLVTLTCGRAGPADVVARVSPDHVEAVIEIKAAPSSKRKDRQSFAEDIMKLHKLQSKARHLHCYFVLLDKSVSVSGATSKEPPDESWRDALYNAGFHQDSALSLPFIEAWDLESSNPPIPRVQHWSKG
jgi:hypothetical protein